MIPDGFKPLLSGKAPSDLSVLFADDGARWLASPKLDGIRCVMFGGVAYSRNLKPIPNAWVQSALQHLPDGFDGELIVGAENDPLGFNSTTSGIMSREGKPDFTYHVFDWMRPKDPLTTPFYARLHTLKQWLKMARLHHVKFVPHTELHDVTGLVAYERRAVDNGYEGVMIRDPNGRYKHGRSTTSESILLKIKRFHDAEAVVIGMVEQMKNLNEQTRDELGYAKRSTHKANKTGKGTLGALRCRWVKCAGNGFKEFEVGTGFNDHERAAIWSERRECVGKIVRFKYQELTPDGKPRFPVFTGFRHEDDI